MDLSKTELDLWAKNVAASLDTSCHHAIEGHTMDSIQQEIANILHIEGFTREQSKEIQEKLNDYRYVGEICDLYRGRHIRWVRLLDLSCEGTNPQRVLTEGTNPQRVLTNGGIVTDIKFQENGIYIQCKNPRNQFMQFRFDHCLVFQKLTPEECILLLCKKNL